MAAISDVLVSDVHAAFPEHACLVSTVLSDDDPRVSPRGSVRHDHVCIVGSQGAWRGSMARRVDSAVLRWVACV